MTIKAQIKTGSFEMDESNKYIKATLPPGFKMQESDLPDKHFQDIHGTENTLKSGALSVEAEVKKRYIRMINADAKSYSPVKDCRLEILAVMLMLATILVAIVYGYVHDYDMMPGRAVITELQYLPGDHDANCVHIDQAGQVEHDRELIERAVR